MLKCIKNIRKNMKKQRNEKNMNLTELNPHIRYARLHYTHLDNRSEFSVCYDCRMFFVENAEGYVLANGNKYNISNGTAIYFPPQTKYSFCFSNNDDFKIIIMDFDLISDFSYLKTSLGTATEENFSKEKVVKYPMHELLSNPIVKTLPHIGTSLKQCTEKFLLKDSFYRESSSALLKLCLLELLRKKSEGSSYSGLCENVIKYIYENYASQTLTNAVIAEEFNYHPYHLNHIVREETGKSLHKHLMDTRLNIAKNYLLTTSYSIDQISWKSGFSSTSYFIKIFKDSVGITPKKYRQTRFHTEV